MFLRLIKHKAEKHMESGGKTPHIPDLDKWWRWTISFTIRPFYPTWSHRYSGIADWASPNTNSQLPKSSELLMKTEILLSCPRQFIFLSFLLSLLFQPLLLTHCRCGSYCCTWHSQWHTEALVRTSLDERSVRRRELYLTTHNSQRRQTAMPLAKFESAIPESELPQTHVLNGVATEIGDGKSLDPNIKRQKIYKYTI